VSKAADDQDEVSGKSPPADFPFWFRCSAIALAALLMVPSLAWMQATMHAPSKEAGPVDFGVAHLLIAGALIALLAITPLSRLGIRIRKVGVVEFERVINTQAKEHAAELAELYSRIEELETSIRRLDSVAPISEYFSELDLRPLLEKFLSQHQPRAFSPLRIQQWGGAQPNFEKLGSSSQSAIRAVLQKMVQAGTATTVVSKLGKTLYRALPKQKGA
jgi:hypothetical protein